jgi:hypothetical protein
MEVKGKIIVVNKVVTGQSKKGTWARQDFVIETGEQYPKKVALSLWGMDLINKYDIVVGLDITASINIESREYNGRWYTEIRAWKLEWSNMAKRPETSKPVENQPSESGIPDDLPF